jgi:hypothetical protein
MVEIVPRNGNALKLWKVVDFNGGVHHLFVHRQAPPHLFGREAGV